MIKVGRPRTKKSPHITLDEWIRKQRNRQHQINCSEDYFVAHITHPFIATKRLRFVHLHFPAAKPPATPALEGLQTSRSHAHGVFLWPNSRFCLGNNSYVLWSYINHNDGRSLKDGEKALSVSYLTSCWENPVTKRVHHVFLPDGGAWVSEKPLWILPSRGLKVSKDVSPFRRHAELEFLQTRTRTLTFNICSFLEKILGPSIHLYQ